MKAFLRTLLFVCIDSVLVLLTGGGGEGALRLRTDGSPVLQGDVDFLRTVEHVVVDPELLRSGGGPQLLRLLLRLLLRSALHRHLPALDLLLVVVFCNDKSYVVGNRIHRK